MNRLAKQPFANPAVPVHHALALEAAACAEQVLPLFEQAYPHDDRPRHALATLRAWVRGQGKHAGVSASRLGRARRCPGR